ncbi:hypothetical protein PV10_08660 [Exophiala mesophila]|uniref:Casein kinase II beta 2 subunit n=1 Tax=Exophiala mesophila TaxID=212818 RepID=A0A0D1XLJ9_EXOME|nr:uncharacterized protein PV10_08660 [Exophiala mesophila]KIV89046.1 hypothetical protein PV10_08660 [Exophiala mesophila]
MASSGGHLLVPKALRLIRFAVEKAGRVIRDKLPEATRTIEVEAQPAYARVQRQPTSRLTQIRQSQSRYYSTNHASKDTVRHYSSRSGASGPISRTSFPSSRTATAVGRSTGRVPFASTLRPSLTGGTLSRSAGGYGLGSGRVGGARYFSHGPAAPAQVVQNVSQAVRAFWLSGQKVRFDGHNQRTGEKRFRAVSTAQEDARYAMESCPADALGSYIDFKVNPTITAIGPLASVPRSPSPVTCDYEAEKETLNNPTVMSNLAVDFARALKELAAIMNDLKHLATLGDLPLSLHNSTTLRVRFPGCDADTVESLCRELNIKRGIVGQDEGFDAHNGTEMALLFPYASSKTPSELCPEDGYYGRPTKRTKRDRVEWHEMLTPPRQLSAGYSHISATSKSSHPFEMIDDAMGQNPWISSPSGYSSLHESELNGDDSYQEDAAMYFFQPQRASLYEHGPLPDDVIEYQGLEGVYRFIEECDRARS